jgi:23S rRNA pseudouridine1911/1915/1917 synthase
MAEVLTFTVTADYDGQRIDKVLSVVFPQLTRSACQKLLDSKLVSVNETVVSKSLKVKTGDTCVVQVPEPELCEAKPENIPLDIRYEDEHLLVVNKEKGMVVHPAPGNPNGTLVNALLYHCDGQLSSINGVIRPGIVHRIDKNTSGLLVVAKDDISHQSLASQIKEHSFTREYSAVVYGNLKEDSGTIDKPIGRSTTDRKKMAVVYKNSKPAVTHYSVVRRFEGFTLVKLRLETGRTHQIRVHMASIGHPIAGDDVYGPRKVITSLSGQCLHAGLLGFIHPITGEYMEVSSELPPYFQTFLSKLNETY